ncbi:MAG TPA: fumarylacetoacetate hydrolase family protein [Solirubrobacteraceae bacterium]|nr:fumarylacetoacetate hydrolase family protein [Solirubrobacteraceae bacterium]
MRFASVLHDGQPYAVAIEDQTAVPLIDVAELGAPSPNDLLRDPPLDRDAAFPLSEATYRPLIPRPEKIICVGLNYKAHIEETQREDSDYPVLFTKFANSLTGPYDTIACPPESEAIDYEGELAVIIGAAARRVSPDRALDVVAGYTVANDVTMRDYQYKTHQWLQGKAWEASTPLGPALVTPDEAGDPGALSLRTLVNGEVVQESSTELMIFPIPTLISVISEFTTLKPGDVILTGTPAGVGFRRDPKLLMSDGDVAVVEIDGIGRLESHFAAAQRG